jgi:hypothetical protein
MELKSIKIEGYDLHCLSKFYTDTSEVTIIRIFELNGINYLSFVNDSDNVLKTLSVDEFEDKFKSFLGSLFMTENTTNEDNSDCECVNCK